jgi:hypothetical protein
MGKNTTMNKLGRQSGIVTDVILLLKSLINIPFKDRSYDIPISIIFPKNYPFDAPEFILDKMPDFGLNPNNKEIDSSTLRIFVSSLRDWDYYRGASITTIIKEVIYCFSKSFPIYRLNSNSNQIPNGQDQNQLISQNNIEKNVSPSRYISPSSQVKPINNYNNLVNGPSSVVPVDYNYLKMIMFNELKANLEIKIREETKKLKQHEEKLNNYKHEFKIQNDKMKQFIDHREDFIEQVSVNLKSIQVEIGLITGYVQQNKDKLIELDNLENYVSIGNTNFLRLISLDCTIEDLILILKRFAEKNSSQFSDVIRSIRAISREQFKIRYCKDKLFGKKN